MSTSLNPEKANVTRIMFISRRTIEPGGVRTSREFLFEYFKNSNIVCSYVGIGKATVASPILRRSFEYISSIFSIFRAYRKFNPDIFHINPSLNQRSIPLHLGIVLLLKLITNKPILIHFRGWDITIGEKIQKRDFIGKILTWVINQGEFIIVLAQDFARQLEAGGIDPSKITVLPEMIATSIFNHPGTRKFNTSDPLKLFFISRLIASKGVWELLEAVFWLRKNHPELALELTIAGSGEEYPKLKHAIQRHGISDIVSLPGITVGKEKINLFLNADIFVFPSKHPEGFPIVIIEAMAAGLPLIYSPVGALKDVLSEENGSCIKIDRLTGEIIGKAILNLYKSPHIRKTMGAQNRKTAVEKYDARIISKQIQNIYDKLILASTDPSYHCNNSS